MLTPVNKMALYSRKEFLELCGHEYDNSARSKISMWIKRGSIIETNGKIDDSIPKNRDWVIKQKDSRAAKDSPDTQDPEIETNGQLPLEGMLAGSIDRRLKLHQIEKLKVDTRIQELKEEKIRGEVVPVDIIKNLFRTHTQSIITSQKDSIEEMLINIAAETRLSGEGLARLRGKMVLSLNTSVDKAIIATEKNMQSMVDEFSIKKEVGEHE